MTSRPAGFDGPQNPPDLLRVQGDYCRLLQVYIRTGVVNPHEPRYGRTASVPLACPTYDIRDLGQAALAGLESIYRPGYRYQKAGVVLMEFVSTGRSRVTCSRRRCARAARP